MNINLDHYQKFLRGKICVDKRRGFDVDPADIHPILKPHQRDSVVWAIRGGRRALFQAFGLGKSIQQIEILRQIHAAKGGKHLIVCPLGVKQEFHRDARMVDVEFKFIRRDSEVDGDGFYITNYESIRDGKLDPNQFLAVSLDEAGCLRSYGSKTFQTFLELFNNPYRFVATATPSPNRFKELIHYAGFLGIMDTGQALTRFFQRDSQKANNLTLYPHKEREFWLWVASWALFLQKPGDLGYSDEGYELPPLKVFYHEIEGYDPGTRWDRRSGQGILFPDSSMSLQDAATEKRNTMDARVAKAREIVEADPESHYLLWHDIEDERRAIKKAIPEAVEVYGAQKLEIREERVIDFSDGKFKYLATKPVLSGSGCNFQRFCHKAIFVGIGFKFHDFIQSIHRIYRFLQTEECEIHILYAQTEREILKVLKAKWKNHERMVNKMSEIIRKYGLGHAAMGDELTRAIGVERLESRGNRYWYANNDNVPEMERMDENSVHLSITSIPFANHYEYTPNYADMGHTEDNDHFWAQMDFGTPNVLRVLKPGRILAVHVKDRILFGNVTGKGAPTVSPFHAEAISHYTRHGFDYCGLITVVTDVVRENNQTYRLGWSENAKDGTKMGVGSPEFVLLFRKPQTDRTKGYADEPVKHPKGEYTRARWQIDAHQFWRDPGDRLPTVEEMGEMTPDVLHDVFKKYSLSSVYDFEHHVKIGEALDAKGKLPTKFMCLAPASHHPDVWTDIPKMQTLNSEQSRRRLQQHVCPLQFLVVDRLIDRYSQPGEVVFDFFGGLGTVPYRAVKKGRIGWGIELNPQSYFDALRYLEAAEREFDMPTLFDFIQETEAA